MNWSICGLGYKSIRSDEKVGQILENRLLTS